jgi:GAF domain-containing protein
MDKNVEKYYQELYEVAAVLNSARNPQEVLHALVASVAKAVGAKGCSLMLLTPDKKVLLHTAAHGLSPWYVKKGPASVDKSISESLEGKPVAILDATMDERIQYRGQAKKEGIVSILSVPMMLREEIIGVIRVYSAEPRQFNTEDIYFVEAVAHLGAIALENARLYEAVKKDYEVFREEMLEWRAALGHEWVVEKPVVPIEE